MEEIILIEVWNNGTHIGLERLTKEKGWEWRVFELDTDNCERWAQGVLPNKYEYERLVVKSPAHFL